ncbi:MAG: hypothetical protein LAT57_13490 [Balneolales bacterium]|nr:hypothetical protein [Balneolales bacterium]
MINRAALIIKYKKPAADWVKGLGFGVMSDSSSDFLKEEDTVFLVSDDVADSPASRKAWLKKNYQYLFEFELFGWSTDASQWPSPITFKLFLEWFDPQFNSMIIDLADEPLEDDGFEE